MISEPLCVDCRWCKRQKDDVSLSKCEKPMPGTDLVSGEGLKQRYSYCTTLRGVGWLSARLWRVCGKEGRFWEPK